MNDTHTQILDALNSYVAENAKFEEKGVAAAASRARAALQSLTKLAKVRRAEIQETKLARKAAK